MVDLVEDVGRTAFEFNLVFAIVITLIGVALLANGVNPGAQVTSLFLPINWIYENTFALQKSLPHDFTPISAISQLGLVGVMGVFLQFLYTMVVGFLSLVYVISTIIPAELRFLIPPLYVLGAFIQLMVWMYFINKLLSFLSQLVP